MRPTSSLLSALGDYYLKETAKHASELRNRWASQRWKSTIFNALTSAKAQAANYPFCTIDPNTGVVTVPDVRLEKISQLISPSPWCPPVMEFIDIAGLVGPARP